MGRMKCWFLGQKPRCSGPTSFRMRLKQHLCLGRLTVFP